MRQIVNHQVNECNKGITINVLDDPGEGGACHDYQMRLADGDSWILNFQNGSIKEVGINGITHEALLHIIIDRLSGFQTGPFACPENSEALDALRVVVEALERRTQLRDERGVEGTHEV